jgi:hypothetical protein
MTSGQLIRLRQRNTYIFKKHEDYHCSRKSPPFYSVMRQLILLLAFWHTNSSDTSLQISDKIYKYVYILFTI